MTKKWFNRLLLSYIPVLILVTFVLSFVFFYMVNNISSNQAKQANHVYTEQVLSTVDFTLKKVEQLVVNAFNNDESAHLFFYNTPEDRYNSQFIPSKKIGELTSLIPEIDSLYLYRATDQSVLMKDSLMQASDSTEYTFIRKLLQDGIPPGWVPVRSFKQSDDAPVNSVVSLVRGVPLLTGEKGFVVVNINVKAIASLVKDMSASKFSYVDIVDQAGNQVVKESEIGHTTTLTTLVSSYSGWQIESGLHDGGTFKLFATIPMIWLVIILLAILSGIAWIVFVTRRNYKPLKAIMDKLESSSSSKSKLFQDSEGQDELQFLDKAITSLIEQSNEYQQQQAQGVAYRRQRFIHDLLTGNRMFSDEDWRLEASLLESTDAYDYWHVMAIGIDGYTEFTKLYDYRDQILLKFVVQNALQEIADKHGCRIWMAWMDATRLGAAIQVLPDTQNPQDRRKVAAHIAGELNEWIRNHLKFTVSVGIGSDVTDVSEVSLSYEEAMHALDYKIVLGADQVISSSEVKVNSQAAYGHYHEIRVIAGQFKQGNAEWKPLFRRLTESMKQDTMSRQELRMIVDYMNYQWNAAFQEMLPEYRGYWEETAFPQLQAEIGQLETVEVTMSRYYNWLERTDDQLKELRERRNVHSTAPRIKAYIDANYGDSNLSLNLLSEHFNLSTKYVSQLFKDEIGIKFTEYLAGLRIEQAKVLLNVSNDSIQEIAKQVGYDNTLSFIRMFKKIEEITPGDYRKLGKGE
ncbi:helix-turn-helix domain-containing protein [Paenibacillus qinlingensis]|uniref:YesN/AraC family two-component response regulator n=1 Tax=Paenibacillus qinlingensis TaxID=1837343 RepID=A0ABU1NWB9_9BACL|nr:helix-turn-helix domain-containing protein [Paenibacillus qinlingensis]MDR6551773.1 YesN/AraC family two-component response regulator [Paenibacillus qinlingensis]